MIRPIILVKFRKNNKKLLSNLKLWTTLTDFLIPLGLEMALALHKCPKYNAAEV